MILSIIKQWFIAFSWRDLVYICIILGVWLFMDKCNHKTGLVKLPFIQPAVQKHDKQGTPYAEIKGTIYTQSDMDHITDSLRRVLGKGRVYQVANTVTYIHDTITIAKPMYVDTVTGDISAVDSNRDIQIGFSGNYRAHTGQFTVDITADTATYVTTWKHKLLRPDELSMAIYHTNHLFTTNSGDVYTGKAPRVRAVLGPSIGVGWSGKWYPFIGVSLTYNVISVR